MHNLRNGRPERKSGVADLSRAYDTMNPATLVTHGRIAFSITIGTTHH
jgi:hypothetical protein